MPESNTSQNENQRTVQVPAPESGASIAVASEAGGNLTFAFDPANATASRVDNNLVFQVDGGGTVTLEGFFEVGDQSLPTLTLPDGTVVAATDFFAGSDLDLSTAAGPGAGAPGSGGTNYDDDGGALLGGIDRLGSLGTDYWGRGTEITEDADGFTFPAAGIDISIVTDLSDPLAPGMDGSFTNVLFEDGQAYQHLKGHQNPGDPGYDDALTPGQLVMVITPSVGTTIDNVALSGFPQGTRITVDGEDFFLSTGPNDVLNLTYAQSQGTILVFPPVDNTDADYTVNWTVTMSSPGYYGVTESGNFVLVVDAVADRPESSVGEGADGREYQPGSGEASEKSGTELKNVAIEVSATFTDNDGSERHFIEVRVPADWILNQDSVPAGWEQITDTTGIANYQDNPLSTGSDYQIILFEVTGEGSNPSATLSFDPKDWTDSRNNAGESHGEGDDNPYADGAPVYVTPLAVETETDPSAEATLDNNAAWGDTQQELISIVEDVPEFYGESVDILSDETTGKQTPDEVLYRFLSDELKDALGSLTDDAKPISVAQEKISYNLFSDGADDDNLVASPTLAFSGDNGTPSGWSTTGGQAIFLYFDDDTGMVIGRVGGENGPIAFVVAPEGDLSSGVNSGTVTFIQYMSLKHPNEGDGSKGSHNEKMTEPSLNLNLVLTDDDGDEISLSVNINVRDDGPRLYCLNNQVVPLSETDLPFGTDADHHRNDVIGNLHNEAKFTGFMGFSYGADGPDPDAPFTWHTPEPGDYVTFGPDGTAYDVVWVQEGYNLTAYAANGEGEPIMDMPVVVITGTPVTDASGAITGLSYTVDLKAPLEHADAQQHDIYGEHGLVNLDKPDFLKIGLGFTLKDGDGDTTSGKLTLEIRDDLPCAGHCTIADTVFEANLRPGLGGQINTSGSLFVEFGADGAAKDNPVQWDVNSVEAAIKGLHVIIDGTSYKAEVEWISATEFEVRAANYNGQDTDPSISVSIVPDGEGGYTYKYTQNHALQHSSGLNIDNVIKDLAFDYIVTDRDGDTASNTLQVNVVDSVLLPSLSAGAVDESNNVNGVITKVMDLNLDAFAPDGMNPEWNVSKIAETLKGLRVTGNDEPLQFSASDDGDILYITDAQGNAVLTLTMLQNPDGTWSVKYEQEQPLDHPLGSFLPGLLGHNDAILLPLDIIGRDAEGNHVHNELVITVFDDGPSIPYGTMTGIVENFQHLGDALAILGKLEGINFGNALQVITEVSTSITAMGADAFSSALQVIDLVFGTNYSQISDITSWDWGLTNIIGNLTKLGEALLTTPANNDFAESPGNTYGGDITVDFGYDGPHAEQAITFSNRGLELVLKLFGIHKTGSDCGLETVRDQGSSGDYTVAAGAEVLDVVKAYNGDPSNGDLVLTFLTIANADGTYSYQVITNGPLAHDPSLIDTLLERLMNAETIGKIGDAMDTLLNELLGLGLPVSQLTDALQGFANLNPGLGGDTLLLILMPIVAQDGDGDKTLGVATVVVRDSVPELDFAGSVSVSESGLDGADSSGGLGQQLDGTGKDWGAGTSTTANGQFTVQAFDGVRGLLIDGVEHTFGDNGKITLDCGPGVITFTLVSDVNGVSTITYTYELTGNAEHAYADQSHAYTLQDGELKLEFQVVDGDNDRSAPGSITVNIYDDKPIATHDFDRIEQTDEAWTATGNILTGDGTFASAESRDAENGAEDGAADKYGADGRAVDSGMYALDADGNQVAFDQTDDQGNYALIEGNYGTLKLYENGEYEYTADPLKLAEAEAPLVQLDPFSYGGTFNASTDVSNVPGMSFMGFISSNLLGNAMYPNDLLPVPAWVATVNGLNATRDITTNNNGLGIGGKALLGDGGDSTIDGAVLSQEGLLITLDNAASALTLTLGDFTSTGSGLTAKTEHATVYLYDANGKLVDTIELTANSGSGDYTWTYNNASGHEFKYVIIAGENTTGPASILDTVSNFTVKSVTASGEVPVYDREWIPEENFNYVIVDADGDTSKATLHIDVNTTPEVLIDSDASNLVVHEDGLADVGTNAGDTDHPVSATGTLQITSGEGITQIEIGGLTLTITGVDDLGNVTFATTGTETVGFGDFGVETITRTVEGGQFVYTVEYTYELTDPTTHTDHTIATGRHEGLDGKIEVIVTVTDKNGDTAEGSFTIDIHDDAPVAGNVTFATVYESDVAGSAFVNAGSDASHDMNNQPGDIYREHLDAVDNTGNDQSVFQGNLGLNYGADGPAGSDAFVWTLPGEEMAYLKAMVNGEWRDVEWKRSDDGLTLKGYVALMDGESSIEVEVIKVTGSENGDYTVAVLAGLKHDAPTDDTGEPDQSYDRNMDLDGADDVDATDLTFTYTIKDADGDTATGSLLVNVQDDIPDLSEVNDNAQVKFSGTQIIGEDIVLDFDWQDGSGTLQAGVYDTANGLTLPGGVIVTALDYDGNSASVVVTNGKDGGLPQIGIGVYDATGSDAVKGEIDGRWYDDDNGTLEYRSETLCFKLPEGEVALGLEFSLNHFFKSTSEPDEQGKVEFYLNGEKVGEYVFGAQDSTGAFVTDSTVTFSYPTTGFDEVRFTALDSGGDKAVGADNSDYALSGLKFLSGPSTAVFAMAEGVIEPNYGADGPLISGNFLVLAGLQGVDAAGNAKTATVDGTEVKFVNVNGIIYGYIGDNYNPDSGLVPTAEDLVCMLQFSQLADYTAKWVLTQYKALDKGNELSLSYTAYDGDGDGVTGDVVINVANQMALGMVDNYVFDESNLTHGTAPEDAALTHEVDLPEGYTVDTNGWAGDNANGYTLSVDGGKGMFTYKDGALTYTVLAEHAHPDPTEENEGLAEKLAFTLNLYDEDGNAVLGKLAVDIKDDAPAVEFVSGATGDITDAMAVGAGAGSTDDTLYLKSGEKIGGTINLERGADGATGSVTINGQTVPTTGELTIQGEGYEGVFKAWYENGVLTYSYQADSTTGTASEGVAINDSFTVSYTDADGDTTTDTLYLHSAAQLDLSQTTTDVTVNEANLGWGTKADQPALTKTGVIDVDSQDRDFSITIGHGANSITLTKAQLENGGGDRMLAEADGKGQFAITGYNPATGQLTYTYTLMGKWAHTSGEATDASLDSVFTVSLTDTASGVVTSGDLTVTILDDAPIAADDFAISNGINSSVTGNVLTGDATTTHVGQDKVGADGSGGVVKVWKGGEADIDPDTTPGTDVSGNVKIDGEFGYLTINSGGTYTYTQTKTWDGATAEKFTYQLNDLEGDKDYATLSISFPKEPGTLIVGQNTDDGQDATDHKWVVGDGSGALSGGAGADVISGDTGGASFPPKDYNFVFVLDYSGSMNSASQVTGKTREQLLEEGLTKMIQEIAKYQGGNVTIYLESFATNHKGENAFLFEMGKDHTATVNNIIALLTTTSFNNSGNTNYEAGLDMAATWLNNGSALAVKPIAGAETYSYFISDGEPNTYMNGASSADVGAQTAVDNAKADDGWNGWKFLAENSHLRGIGIGTSKTMMTYINQIDENGAGINPTDADFAKVLLSLNPLKFAEAGDDLINGGAGGDILFGDVLNTDELAKRINLKDASGRDADPGLGWAVFAALEAGTGLEFYVDVNGDVQEGGTGWTRDDTLRYINAHHEELGAESTWTGNLTPADPNGEIVTEVRHGGDDLIIGGAQDDIIYGQEGDDVIFGDDAPAGSENWSMTQWQNGIADYMGGNPTTQEGLAVKAAVEGANESDGNDLIHGGSGDDIIFGGGGGDLLVGGTGHDILFGGSGNDTFAWSTSDFDNGTDKIMDFTQGEDFIRLNLGDLVSDQTGTLDDLLGKISWSADQDNDTLTLTVAGDNSTTQTIEVHFDGGVNVEGYTSGSTFADFCTNNNVNLEDANDAAMKALITSLLG